MRQLKSLIFAAVAAVTLSACSGSEKEVEHRSEQELYNQAQSYLQEGDYSEAIRYLNAAKTRFPTGVHSEQTQLGLIYANYKKQDYTQTLVNADRFIQLYPNSPNLDYAIYMAGLTNSALGDNMIQDFFGVDRATRESTSIKTAFSNFQTLVQYFPQSPYAADAIARMAYIKDSLARHELEIAKFYAKRNAHVAVANRVVEMLKHYPDTRATLEALPLMKEAYEKMGLTKLATQTETVIQANQNKQFAEVQKPEEPEQLAPKQ